MKSVKCFSARWLGKTSPRAGSWGPIQNCPLRIPDGEIVSRLKLVISSMIGFLCCHAAHQQHYCDFSNRLWQSHLAFVTLSPRPSLHLCHFVPRRNSARARGGPFFQPFRCQGSVSW